MSIDTETRAYLCQLENPTVARPPRRGRGLAYGGPLTDCSAFLLDRRGFEVLMTSFFTAPGHHSLFVRIMDRVPLTVKKPFSDQRLKEGECLIIYVTGPGATVVLGFMF